MTSTLTPFSEIEAERSRKAKLRAIEAEAVRDKARANRDAALARAATQMIGTTADSKLDSASWDRFTGSVRKANQFDRWAELAGKAATEARQTVRITSEPLVYSAHSRHSYWRDLAVRVAGPTQEGYAGAAGRLERHGDEVRVTRGDAIIRETYRNADPAITRAQEKRAVSNATFSFAAPQYLIAETWVPFNAPNASFTQQARLLDLPPYGLEVHIPALTSALTVASPTENIGVTDTDPVGSDLGPIPIVTFAGAVTMSSQLFERGGYEGAGGSLDEIITVQSAQQMMAALDTYVLTAALVNAGVTTEATTLTTELLYANVAACGEALADTAGVRFPGSHVFATTDVVRWLTKQYDGQGRPIVTPDLAAIETANTPGYTGLVLPGTLKLFADDNLHTVQTASANPTFSQLLVTQSSEVLVWRSSSPISFAYQETDAASLSVVVGFRCYVASVPRHSASVQVATGAGYANIS